MATLDEWTATVGAALGLPADVAGATSRDLVLDLARDVAHGVARPAAPLTAYLVGVAVGAGADPRIAAETVADLARSWPAATAPAAG